MSRSKPIGKTPIPERSGFTLIEAIIAMGMASVVLITVISLQTSVISCQHRWMVNHKLSTDAAYTAEVMKRDIKGATFIISPAKGETASTLRGYVNVDPFDLESPLISSKPGSYFIYCLNPGGNVLYRHTGPVPAPLSFEAFACGNDPGEGQTRQALITASEETTLSYLFTAEGESSNLVRVGYMLLSGKEEITGKFSTQIQRGL